MEEEIKYVKRSKVRMRAMKALKDEVKRPFEIAKEAEIYHNHISNTLRELKEKGLVECINPEVSKGRLYRLTDKGEKIVKYIG